MGCWGLGIMQSDDALDAQLDIYESTDLYYDEKKSKIVQKSFLENFDKIENVCNKYKDVDSFSCAVYWQVLAYEGMRHGVQFNAEQQEKIVEGITFCREYQDGINYPDKQQLHQHIKEQYIKDFGLADWEQRESIWGEESLTQRVIERTKNISQLLQDFKNYTNNDFKPFERQEDGLFDTMEKKMKM